MPHNKLRFPPVTNTHLVKGEDLNHHQTLYGGRCVEWCVHMAYVAAQSCFEDSRPLVFMSIRSLLMRTPARLGDLVEFTACVDYLGETTIGVRVDARRVQPRDDSKPIVTGTFLFCTVDNEGHAVPHELPPVEGTTNGTRNRWKRAEEEFMSAAP